MKPSEIAQYRLVSQQIATSEIQTAPEMVKWFGAVQGQEYAQTKWGLGLRLPHLKEADIENDLRKGRILRTHLLRPTWHFVADQDIRWMLMLTAPRVHAANAYMYRKLELESKLFLRCHKILLHALEGGKQLTRDALKQELKKIRITAEGFRLGYIMMHAELEGLLCSGPRQGNQSTYMLLEERVPPCKMITRDEALAELTRRYFSSRGPATAKDFSTWSGLTLTECKKGIEFVRAAFHVVEIENEKYLFSDSGGPGLKPEDAIHLLPIYDEYIMGYKSRQAIFLSFRSSKPKPALPFDSTIILSGQVAGTWRRTIKPKSIELEYDLFTSLNKNQKGLLEKAIVRFKKFTTSASDNTSVK